MGKSIVIIPAGQILTVTPVGNVQVYRPGAAAGGFLATAASYGPYMAAREIIVNGDATVAFAVHDEEVLQDNLGLPGTLAETFPRSVSGETNTAIPSASGTLFLQAIYLKAGMVVSNITISSASTAAVSPTNYFFALYDANRVLRAVSVNQLTAAWAANTVKTLAMATPYRVPTSGLYYIGLMMTAGTIITTKGNFNKNAAHLAGAAPILGGVSTAGLTTSMPDPAAALSGGTTLTLYAAVS